MERYVYVLLILVLGACHKGKQRVEDNIIIDVDSKCARHFALFIVCRFA